MRFTIHIQISDTPNGKNVLRDYLKDFIKQAVVIAKTARSGEHSEMRGFRWICETKHFGVEQFLVEVDDEWRERFIASLREGK